jgi:hypothetical protein
MGEGIRKITGDLPGWKATEEQKLALEKMVNGVKEQERPAEEELVELSNGAGVVPGKGYTGQREEDEGEKGILQGGRPSMPYIPGITSKKKTKQAETHSKVQQDPPPSSITANRMEDRYSELTGEGVRTDEFEPVQPVANAPKKRPNKISRTQTPSNPNALAARPPNVQRQSSQMLQKTQDKSAPAKPPAKPTSQLQSRQPSQRDVSQPRKKPRKLEVRSAATKGSSRA